jgi:acyl-coenzyme A synthetase/AMP-(fatty) acid ligase
MIVGTVPPHHMYGFETTILLPLHAAVSSWCHPVFYPADLHAALASPTARSVLVTTPLQLRAMLAMRGAQHFPDTVISATAPLDAELAAEAERVWHSEVLEIFGATEVGSIASRRTVADADWSLYPGVTLSGEDGPLVTAPGAASRRLSDVVTLLDGGQRFRLIGRCGDMVKLGGRRASLAGLTRALTGLEGVSDGVFVAPDDIEIRPTARLMALVVSPALSNEDVLGALRQRIDPVFMPRPLVRVAALPRNALGKLPRQDVLSLLARHAPARPGRATF